VVVFASAGGQVVFLETSRCVSRQRHVSEKFSRTHGRLVLVFELLISEVSVNELIIEGIKVLFQNGHINHAQTSTATGPV
jgi:hypothetical protein